jgi:NADP-dependent 3-hydroxy acid dehydrogenase YdfG
MDRHIVITGASAGIGAATARLLTQRGARLSLGARRVARLREVAPGAFAHALDVTDEASVAAFLDAARAAHGPIDVLINNAGLARLRETVAEARGDAWREMVETNVMGVLHVTRRVLPEMLARRSGHVVMIGSIAAYQSYAGGSVYCATKRAVTSLCEALRHETLGSNVRITNVEPGLVETEFSLVRFRGDAGKAAAVYRDTRPLQADDIAECIEFALSRPPHVNIDRILVLATDQADATTIRRTPGS